LSAHKDSGFPDLGAKNSAIKLNRCLTWTDDFPAYGTFSAEISSTQLEFAKKAGTDMTGRESLLAEIEARRHQKNEDRIEVLKADLGAKPEEAGYNPYDNPGPAKTVTEVGRAAWPQSGRKILKKRR
jgi:hypothetical protein